MREAVDLGMMQVNMLHIRLAAKVQLRHIPHVSDMGT